jgi:hypothetical protein
MAIINSKCPKCGGMMEIQSDGFTGFDASCITCGKRQGLVTTSIPVVIRQRISQYEITTRGSPMEVHISSMAIRKASGDIRIVFTTGNFYARTAGLKG